MKLSDIDRHVVLATLTKMNPTFRTKELSSHPDMLAAHPCANDYNYHAMIGKYLSEHVQEVRQLEASESPEGVLWQNEK